jgi:hypothetical protein
MMRLPKMETILEEVFDKDPGTIYLKVEPSWKKAWYTSHDLEWDQWIDIEYMDEPSTPPPEFKITARQ